MKSRYPAHRSLQGMVLLEVIIALSIFAVVSLGLVLALNKCFDTAEARNTADAATRGLANQLAMLKAGPLIPGEHDLTDNGTGASYHLSVAPEPMLDQRKTPVVGLYRATLTATWKEGSGTASRKISELVYQP